MTEKIAIEILNNEKPSCGEKIIYPEGEGCEAYGMAIEALEKQMLKKPIIKTEKEVPYTMDVKKKILEEIDNLTYYPEGMGCGIEDCGITDRYEACEYGWDKAIEAVVEAITNMI